MGHGNLEGTDLHLRKTRVDEQKDFEITLGVVHAYHVEITLPELAVAALLGLLAAPDLAYVVALEREAEYALVCGHITCEGHCEVESQRDVASSVVRETEHLLIGLSAAFAEKNLGVFERGGIDGNETEGAQYFLYLGHEFLSDDFLLRQAVSESFQDFWFYHIHLW